MEKEWEWDSMSEWSTVRLKIVLLKKTSQVTLLNLKGERIPSSKHISRIDKSLGRLLYTSDQSAGKH